MKLWKSVGLAVLVVGLVFGCTTVSGNVVPTLPSEDHLIGTRFFSCGGVGAALYTAGFDLDGDPEYSELVIWGTINPDGTPGTILLWLEYKPGTSELLKVTLTLPGKDAEIVTWDELLARYPSPCALLVGAAKGKKPTHQHVI